eukprot:TRINITY_DN57159_c0_g1_i1.p1 TRINITY_DN57159_c0_g1~~TRINITY_DN57159_c0_g1_i1.p1  ORF type:complete len:160 (+),score=16.73 TRINITY_DN57159_c0_g1_i1:36-515(+)
MAAFTFPSVVPASFYTPAVSSFGPYASAFQYSLPTTSYTPAAFGQFGGFGYPAAFPTWGATPSPFYSTAPFTPAVPSFANPFGAPTASAALVPYAPPTTEELRATVTPSMPYAGPNDQEWLAATQYSQYVHPFRRPLPKVKRQPLGIGLFDSYRGEPSN